MPSVFTYEYGISPAKQYSGWSVERSYTKQFSKVGDAGGKLGGSNANVGGPPLKGAMGGGGGGESTAQVGFVETASQGTAYLGASETIRIDATWCVRRWGDEER